MGKRKTHKEFCEDLEERHPGEYTVIEEYKGSAVKIEMRHNKCGNLVKLSPNEAYTHAPCKYCGTRRIAESRRKSHEEYKREILELNDDITFLEEYKGIDKRVKIRFESCGHVKDAIPSALRKKYWCGRCVLEIFWEGNKIRPEEFRRNFEEAAEGEYVLLTEYTNSSTKIEVLHLKCGKKYEVTPHKFMSGQRCRDCQNKKSGALRRSTTEKFSQRLIKKRGNEYEVASKYRTKYDPIKIRHTVCGRVYETYPALVIAGGSCPFCPKTLSKGEGEVGNTLDKLEVTYEREKPIGGVLRADFYLPDYQAYIEYDGEQHFRPVEYFGGEEEFLKGKSRDKVKDYYFHYLGFPILRIPYWDFVNIDGVVSEFVAELEEEQAKRKEMT